MIDKSFVYFGHPQLYLRKTGTIMIHIAKEQMGNLENFLVAEKESSPFFKIYKKYELGETLYLATSANDRALRALLQKFHNFIDDRTNIHLSLAESRAKFRRKVKSWMKKLDSLKSASDQAGEKVSSSLVGKNLSYSQAVDTNWPRQGFSKESSEKAVEGGRICQTKFINALGKGIEVLSESVDRPQVPISTSYSFVKRKENQFRDQFERQKRKEAIISYKITEENQFIADQEVDALNGIALNSLKIGDLKNQMIAVKGGMIPNQNTILHVSGASLQKVNGLQGLCRLFSSFGKIERAVFSTSKIYFLVQFGHPESAERCIENLDGMNLGGGDMLCISYSKKQSLNNLKGPQSTYLIYRESDHPSTIRNDEFCTDLSNQLILELVPANSALSRKEHQVESLIFARCYNMRIHAKVSRPHFDRTLWIAAFINIEEASLAIMHLHGLVVGHQSIHAKFAAGRGF